MKRLTTDNPKSSVETMLNYAYAKDGRVFLRYGNGEEDIDICEYIAQEAADKCCHPTSEEIMEGACMDCDCSLAILKCIATQAAELRERLKYYEDREEKQVSNNDLIESNLPEATREFLLLTRENPTLPILPLVDHECVADEDGPTYWLARIGRSEIREYCFRSGNVMFKEQADENALKDLAGCWLKAIFVYITPV